MGKSALSAVLLAGGRSSRMGRDKASLLVEGQPLWERQLSTLRRLDPVELFISGKADGPYAGAGIEIIPDTTPGRGPLSGLEASLRRATSPLVLVLAIDLPAMSSNFLVRLAHFAKSRRMGVVPQAGEWFEALAAIYPRDSLPLVEKCLDSEDLSMQSFIRQAMGANLVLPWKVTAQDEGLFRNVNTPADLENG